MGDCITLSPTNNDKSLLNNIFLKITKNSQEEADKLYKYILSDDFKNDFGDWTSLKDDVLISKRHLTNGEPNIFYDKNKDGYFYFNKYDTKTPFPPNYKGLKEYFSSREIKDIVNRLSYASYIKHFGEDFNNTDIFLTSFDLQSTLRQYLSEKLEETGNRDIELLQIYEDELIKKVKDNFKKIGLIYREQLNEFEEDKDENSQIIPKASFTTNSKQNESTNVKLKLSFLPIEERDEIFNEKKFVPHNVVYLFLQSQLNDLFVNYNESKETDMYKIMLDKIVELSKTKPYLKKLVEMLNNPNTTINEQSEFFQAFNMNRKNFLVTEIIKGENSTNITIKNVSDVNNKNATIIKEWHNNFNDLFLNNKELNKNKLKLLNEELNKKLIYSDFIKILKKLGVNIDNNTLEDYTGNYDYKFEKAIISIKYLIKDLIEDKINVNFNNPFKTQPFLKELSKSNSKYFDEITDHTIFSGGKNNWIFGNPSYIDNHINTLKSDRQNILNLYNEPINYKNNKTLEYLLAKDFEALEPVKIEESLKRIKNVKTYVFNVLQEKNKSGKAVNNKEISFIDSISESLTKTLQFKKGGRSYYTTPTPADKGTRRELSLGYNIDTGFRYKDGKIILNEEVYETFYNYFKYEYSRMITAYNDIKNNNRLYTYFHTNKNGDIYNKNTGKLEGNAFKSQLFTELNQNTNDLLLYGDKGEPILNNLDIIKDEILSIIKNILHKNIRNEHSTLNNIFDNKLQKSLDINIWTTYENSSNRELHIISDYLINNFIQQIEFGKIFLGDVAYYKDMSDYNKRIAGLFSEGLYLRLGIDENDTFFNLAVVDNVFKKGSDFENLKHSLGEKLANFYLNVNSTDAQSWITPQRWKFLNERLGKWNDKTHQVLYEKMLGINTNPITDKEFKIAAQPLKGVYFEKNNGVPTYLKYSQAVLIPAYIKGTALESVYNKMIINDNNNELPYHEQIHEIVVLDGIKVGSHIPNVINDSSFRRMQLLNKGWKLQQDLPTKGFSQVKLGTQIQKVLLAGLSNDNLNKIFNINNEEKTGLEVLNEINDIIGRLSEMGSNNIINRLGINNDFKITNEDGFYKLLIEELKKRDVEENLIESLNKGLSIYSIPQSQKQLLNTFFSLVNDETLKIKTNGGAFIQISDYGLEKSKINEKGIKWFINPKDGLKRPKMDLSTKKITPGQILLPASMFSKELDKSYPSWRELSGKELLKKIDPKILNTIIGYRIPNQAMSSNDALDVVGLLPETMGDSIIAYTEIPTKTGSDFDIDKMFIMIPNIEFKNNKLRYISSDNKDDVFSVQNRLLELYKGILLNENTFMDLMTPVDFDFIKLDMKKYFPEDTTSGLYSFNIVNQIKLKHNFMGGVTGIGQSANMLNDHIRGMFINMTLNKYNIGWGHSKDDETILDNEYSEEENGVKFKITHSISAILNAYVDIANDSYIMRANWNSLTANTAFLMLRAGVHPFKVNAFIGQPIIKDYVEAKFNNEGKISTKKKDITGIILNKYNYNVNEYYNINNMSLADLRSELKNPSDIIQTNILKKFLELQNISKNLKNNVIASKIDTVGPKDLNSLLIWNNRIKDIFRKEDKDEKGAIIGFEEKFNSSLTNNKTFLNHYYHNNIKFLNNITKANPRLFLMANENIENTFNELSNEIKKGKEPLLLNENLGSILESEYYSYISSDFKNFKDNFSLNDLFINLSDEIKNYKNISNNYFINQLEIRNDEKFKFIGLNNRFKPKGYKDDMTEGWLELMEEQPELANKIIQYSFYQSGFKNNMFQIYSLIPNEWFIINKFDNFIIEKSQELNNYSQHIFKDQFYRHNWDNSLIVPKIYKVVRHIPGASFTLNTEESSPEFLNYNDNLYQLEGYNNKLKPIYFKTFKLGFKGKKGNVGRIIEYKYNKLHDKSIIDDNNVDIEFINKSINNTKITFREHPNKSKSNINLDILDKYIKKGNNQINTFLKGDNTIPECIE